MRCEGLSFLLLSAGWGRGLGRVRVDVEEV